MILSSKKEKVVMEEVTRKRSNDLVVLAITFVILTSIIAVCYYAMNDRKLMAANIENGAIAGRVCDVYVTFFPHCIFVTM